MGLGFPWAILIPLQKQNLSNNILLPKPIMNKQYYIGLDVHKKTIAIAYSHAQSREEAIYHGSCGGGVVTAERALRKLAKELETRFQDLKVCYEAGPTGFVLGRHLIGLGLDCVLCAPSKTERKPNEAIKTDKRDAKKLAKLFKNGDLTLVRIPPELDEAVRDVSRARTDASDDLGRAKQRLLSFLLRQGHSYTGKSNWTDAHMRYLRKLKMNTSYQQIVLEEYIQAIDQAEGRVQTIKSRMIDLLEAWEWKPIVKALMACKGFQEVAAITLVSELGDLRRFDSPRKLMSFLGLIPSEHSSGSKRRLGAITRCGNSHARWMLVECAQHFRKPPKVSAALTSRQAGISTEVKALSWRMQNRLHKRYVKLKLRGKEENKCIIAVARELSAFLWELMNKCDLPIPESSSLPVR
jgi:transposase